jgi:hypothetical protein
MPLYNYRAKAPGDFVQDPSQSPFDAAFSGDDFGWSPKAVTNNAPDGLPSGVSIADVPTSALPQIDKPGLFGRIRQTPGASKALMAFGAQMMMAPSFFQGLGKGVEAYQNTIDAEKDKLRPQLTKDGTFTYSIDPQTGQATFNRTPVADYQEGIWDRRLKSAEAQNQVRTDGAYQRTKYQTDSMYKFKGDELDYRDRWERNDNSTDIRVAEINASQRDAAARMAAAGQSHRPPPGSALTQFTAAQGYVDKANQTLSNGGRILGYLDGGLDLGIATNLRAKASQVTGYGANAATRQYGELQQFVQTLANAKLMDARGVQTDGDAVRARIETLISSGDSRGAAEELRNALRDMERYRDYNAALASDIADTYGISAPRSSAVANSAGSGNGSLRAKYGLE